MKKLLLIFLGILVHSSTLRAQHTFSIVAVDPVTGEVGSAGASCVSGFSVNIIAFVLPGVGAMNTQAWWQSMNKNLGAQLMISGYSPQEIIDSLSIDDRGTDGRDERWRQYGAVDLNAGSPRTAAWTGDSADDWKGHITGPNYSIQGNILLGPQILDSMEARFLNTTGELAEKLMAALQGANVPGADSRCLSAGTSSTGSYIQVAKPSDVAGGFYLNLNVPPLSSGNEPIDSLQQLFDEWKLTTSTAEPVPAAPLFSVFPSPAEGRVTLRANQSLSGKYQLEILDIQGRVMLKQDFSGIEPVTISTSSLANGLYLFRIQQEAETVQTGKILVR